MPLRSQIGLTRRLRHDAEADAEAGRKAFRERLGQDHRLFRFVVAPHAAAVGAVVAQLAVGGVLEHEDALILRPALGHFDQLAAALFGEADAAGVLVIADGVDQLHAGQLAGGLQALEFLFEQVHPHAVFVGGDRDRPRAQALQHA